MSTIIVVTVDAGGNVAPALRIAGELADRGHRIEVLGHRRQAAAVAGAGHAFRPLDALDFWDSGVRRSVPTAISQAARLAADREVEREVREVVASTGAHGALVDCLMASSIRGAQAGGARAAVLFHTFLRFWESSYRQGPVGIAARLRGADPRAEWARAAGRLVVSDVALDPASAGRTASAHTAEWVGSLEPGTYAERDVAAPPFVVVSLSTTWFPGQTDAYQRIASALGTLPVRGVITLGGLRPDRELRLPPNVSVLDRADHGELFPRASLVIGHGGHSTTFRALAHGVPLLVVPMHPLLDQPMIGRSVEHAGAGRAVPKSSSPARLAAAATALLADDRVRSAAARLGERLRSTDAVGAAADALERIIGEPSRDSRRATPGAESAQP